MICFMISHLSRFTRQTKKKGEDLTDRETDLISLVGHLKTEGHLRRIYSER